MAIGRARKRLSITRKKKVLPAQEQDAPEVQPKRWDFLRAVRETEPRRLVFVDETGAHPAMTRTHGRAPAGPRVAGAVPGHWDSFTLISALRQSGATAAMVFSGATNTMVFRGYVEPVLLPELQPGAVVIWDNLPPPQAAGEVEAVEQAGAHVIPRPPSSPDLTPIEKDQADSTSSARWCEAAGAGYDRRLRTA